MTPRSWLCIGPAILCLLDGGLTLLGQSDFYWSGKFHEALEWNPLALWILRQHPLLFTLGLILWMAIFCTLIVSLPSNLARLLAFSVQLGHTVGAATWLTRMGAWGWVGVAVLFLGSRLLLDRTWERAGVRRTPEKS
jgi:hypothetical protein